MAGFMVIRVRASVGRDGPVEETAASEPRAGFRVLELGWSKKPGEAEGEGKAHEWQAPSMLALPCLKSSFP